ncbi:MAG: hypothetical protein H7258_10530 [Ferruginibacter sp.]|nr:hypothetical protein [Ferruginibacter sp.]
MKLFLKILPVLFFLNTSVIILSERAVAQPTISFQAFYDDLSPHGSWFESPDYGYVWRPQLPGFAPYSTNGYWVLTDAGWTWVSDYSWGWAPFHYGRWYNDPFYGYVWVPGYEWGPGWVSWRRSNEYYGWTPIGPGVSLGAAYGNGYNVSYNQWNFVRCNDFGRRNIHNYYIDKSKNVAIINNTTVINNTRVDKTRNSTYSPGPDRMEVQKQSGRTITPIAIVDENKPARHITKNSVQLYRPVIQNNSNAAIKPAPAKLMPLNEVKQHSNIKPVNQNDRQDERRAKQSPVLPTPVKPADNSLQPVEQNNSNERPLRKTIRDAQPVRQAPVQQPNRGENNIAPTQLQPEKQAPVREQSVPRESRREHSSQPVTPQHHQPVRDQNMQLKQQGRPRSGINRSPVIQAPVRQ